MQWLFLEKAAATWFEGAQWTTFDLSPEQAKAGWPFVTGTGCSSTSGPRSIATPSSCRRSWARAASIRSPCAMRTASFSMATPATGCARPKNAPARDFWSAIACDFATHGFIRGSSRVGVSSLDRKSLRVNEDGSVDVWFAPKAPEGWESNWVPTGRPFWIALRLHGPEKPLFDKTWTPGDIE